MGKPISLTDGEIREIENRIIRGWTIRRPEWAALVAMALERNLLVAERVKELEAKAQAEMAMGLGC